jgi:predicted kinase
LAGHPFDLGVVTRADVLARDFLAGRAELFTDRIESGHIVDGHGDLLADDVFVLDDGPRLLDCVEFDDELRHVDVVDDLAVLVMELRRLDAPDLATRLVEGYERASRRELPEGLLHFYVAYRAQVRALVAALRAAQADDDEARTHYESDAAKLLDLCVDHLEQASVRLVVVGGLPGTGKTTVATEIGRRTGWPVLHSDVVRKELTGHRAEEVTAAPYRRGIYTPEMTEATYDTLLERARERLELGMSVVVDASFVAEADRDCARLVAQQTHAQVIELRCTVDPVDAADRIQARRAAGGDASDADATIAARLGEVADPWPESRQIDNGGSIDLAVTEALAAVGPT